MSIVETTVTINGRGEWVKRFMRKNTKAELAHAVYELQQFYEKYEATLDPEASSEIEKILVRATW